MRGGKMKNERNEDFVRAARENNLVLLDELLQEVAHDPAALFEMVSAEDFEALANAFSEGHLDVAKAIWGALTAEQRDANTQNIVSGSCAMAATLGHLKMINWFLEVRPELASSIVEYCLGTAVSNGRLEVVNLLFEKDKNRGKNVITQNTFATLVAAVDGGHSDVVKTVLAYLDGQDLQNALTILSHGNDAAKAIAAGYNDDTSQFRRDVEGIKRLIADGVSSNHLQILEDEREVPSILFANTTLNGDLANLIGEYVTQAPKKLTPGGTISSSIPSPSSNVPTQTQPIVPVESEQHRQEVQQLQEALAVAQPTPQEKEAQAADKEPAKKSFVEEITRSSRSNSLER
jgi:hypothetical protein